MQTINSIYIADDSTIDLAILEAALSKLGFSVSAFSSGTLLLDAVRMAKKPVVILLDWLMPDRNGVDICNELSTDPPPDLVYTIIVTSRTEKSDIAYALEQGADDYIAKPLNLTELRARINVGIRLLNFRQQLLDVNARLLQHSKEVEEIAKSRAEQLIRADRLSTIGVLSAGMAHEINNPTSFVSVNIQTLEENLPLVERAITTTTTPEEKKRAQLFISMMPQILEEMKAGIIRIQTIVNGLKTYAHASPEHYSWFSIESCIDTALHLCANKLKYHVAITKQLMPVPQIYGEQRQIEQVLINLITNATDAIEEQGNEGELIISTGYENGWVITSVRDTGAGISSKNLEKLFMPFYTTKPLGKGTGLGLSISQNIIKDHKGELIAGNHPDGGALFSIRLPAKQG